MGTRRGIWLLLGTLSALGLACSSPESLSPDGGSCLMDPDCELGLVCIRNACTDNLGPLVNIESDVGVPSDAPAMKPDASTAMPEASAAEGSPEPETSSSAPDATQPPMDATGPTPVPEASPAMPDASSGSEASPGPNDAATGSPDAATSGG